MAEIEILLPKMGESVAEATIVGWLKNEGESIEEEESIIEIATDKVDSEVPAPSDGILVKRLVNEGDVVQVGAPIAIISTNAETAPSTSTPSVSDNNKEVTQEKVTEVNTTNVSDILPKNGNSGRFYSPLVRNIAKQENIQFEELEQIEGSGKNGRVTKHDILFYLDNRSVNGSTKQTSVNKKNNIKASDSKKIISAPSISVNGNDEIIEMDRMRKLIADHMVMSKTVSPHVTSYVEADVTNIVNWRNKHKKSFQEKNGEKLTFTPIFIEAIAKAIQDFPLINVSVDGDNIIKRGDINIGMATALPSGNLIVPVIKNADNLNLKGLAKAVNDLANRARNNQLKPEEIQNGTYTVTNVGTFGNVMGTPIINQPQCAIMALGAIRKKPAVIETPEGDFIGIRHMMFLSHAYDHRVIDGALGGSFVRKVADYLENFDVNQTV